MTAPRIPSFDAIGKTVDHSLDGSIMRHDPFSKFLIPFYE